MVEFTGRFWCGKCYAQGTLNDIVRCKHEKQHKEIKYLNRIPLR